MTVRAFFTLFFAIPRAIEPLYRAIKSLPKTIESEDENRMDITILPRVEPARKLYRAGYAQYTPDFAP